MRRRKPVRRSLRPAITEFLSADQRLKDDLTAEAQMRGIEVEEFIKYLYEFYDMQHLDDLIGRIRRAEMRGFNFVELAHLSVLYSVMKRFNMKYKL
jgi:energy-converting hydrogenase A subunit M